METRPVIIVLAVSMISLVVIAIAAPSLLQPFALYAGPAFSFGVAGDHGANSNTNTMLTNLVSSGAAFYLALGDFSYSQLGAEPTDSVTPSPWCDYVKTRVGATFPFQLVMGNHEDDAGPDGYIYNFSRCLPDRMNSVKYAATWTGSDQGTYGTLYYFDYPSTNPGIRVIMVGAGDTDKNALPGQPNVGTVAYNFVSAAIDSARAANIPWVAVGMHKVCIEMGVKPCEIGADFMNLLINKRVDIVLQAHNHNYERSKQLTCANVGVFTASCVADDGADNAYVKGVGTVFVMQGLGGVGLTNINGADTEAQYFVKAMGASGCYPTGVTCPTNKIGFVKYTVSGDSLTATTVLNGGETFDSFSITAATGPGGLTNSFTYTTSGRTVTTTASASGGTSPYTHTWTWGDGSPTETGASLSHTYAADGSYTVTLSTTDSASGTVTATQQVMVGTTGGAGPPPVILQRQYWGTFYYPWYGRAADAWFHWGELGHSPTSTWASNYLPDLGSGAFDPAANLYSSKDLTVLDRHIALADRIRLDALIVSWWGPGDYTDQSFQLLMGRINSNSSLGVRAAVYYEDEASLDPPVSTLVSDLTYIYNSYGVQNGYFNVADGNGTSLPVVFVFAGGTDGAAMTTRWADARAQMYAAGKPMFIVLKVYLGYATDAAKVDSWHQYAPSLRFEVQSGYSAFVSPGYWEYPELATARGRNPSIPVLTRDAVAFENAVNQMKALSVSQAKFLLFATFNEWHEGSQIEPAMLINHVETGFTSAGASYGTTYLDIINTAIPPRPEEPVPPPPTGGGGGGAITVIVPGVLQSINSAFSRAIGFIATNPVLLLGLVPVGAGITFVVRRRLE